MDCDKKKRRFNLEKTKNILSKNSFFVVTIAVFASALYPLVKIARYARPCVDDFAYSNAVHNLIASGKWNLFSVLKQAFITDMNFYKGWQGLYSSAFILALHPGIIGEKYYCLGTWALMLFIFASIYFFMDTVSRLLKIFTPDDKIRAICINFCMAFGMTAILLAGLPSAVQGLYWFNGAWNYMPFFFLTVVNICLCLKYRFEGKKWCLILSVINSFIISGGNHVTSFLNIMLISLFIAAEILKLKKLPATVLSWLSAVVGFIIMAIAPGTAARHNAFISLGYMIPSIPQTLIKCADYFFEITSLWIGSVQYLRVLLIITCIACLVQGTKKYTAKELKFNPIYTLVMLYLLICGMLCVPYKAMGGFGEGRLTNVIWLAFMFISGIAWFYSSLWVMARMKITQETAFNATLFAKVCIVLVCVFSVWFNESNCKIAKRELQDGTAQNYANAFDQRLVLINRGGSEPIVVDALPTNSKMLYFTDITNDANGWQNNHFKSYYNRVVVTK